MGGRRRIGRGGGGDPKSMGGFRRRVRRGHESTETVMRGTAVEMEQSEGRKTKENAGRGPLGGAEGRERAKTQRTGDDREPLPVHRTRLSARAGLAALSGSHLPAGRGAEAYLEVRGGKPKKVDGVSAASASS